MLVQLTRVSDRILWDTVCGILWIMALYYQVAKWPVMRSPEIQDDVIKWKHFPRYWAFVQGIHRWPSPQKGQWRRALMFSLICAWLNGWVNSDEAVIWDAIAPIMTSLWCWKVQDGMSKIHHTALKFGTTIQQHCCKSHFTSHQPKGSVGKMPFLTHWSRYKTADILQKVFSNASPSIKFVHSTGYNSLPVSYLCWAY